MVIPDFLLDKKTSIFEKIISCFVSYLFPNGSGRVGSYS